MIAVAIMSWPQTGRAADEDMTTSVYLEFDPKTGDFKTVQDHDRSKQLAEDQDPAHYANELDPAAGADVGSSTPVIVVSAVALAAALLGIAVFWIRRSRKAR